MTTTTQTLASFLLARIGEREALARAASPGGWTFPGIDSVAGGNLYDETRRIVDVVYEQPKDHDGTIVRHLLVPEADANGAHIAANDPAHVLAQCAALRAVVEAYEAVLWVDAGDREACAEATSSEPAASMLRALAQPYRDHPEWRAEWAS